MNIYPELNGNLENKINNTNEKNKVIDTSLKNKKFTNNPKQKEDLKKVENNLNPIKISINLICDLKNRYEKNVHAIMSYKGYEKGKGGFPSLHESILTYTEKKGCLKKTSQLSKSMIYSERDVSKLTDILSALSFTVQESQARFNKMTKDLLKQIENHSTSLDITELESFLENEFNLYYKISSMVEDLKKDVKPDQKIIEYYELLAKQFLSATEANYLILKKLEAYNDFMGKRESGREAQGFYNMLRFGVSDPNISKFENALSFEYENNKNFINSPNNTHCFGLNFINSFDKKNKDFIKEYMSISHNIKELALQRLENSYKIKNVDFLKDFDRDFTKLEEFVIEMENKYKVINNLVEQSEKIIDISICEQKDFNIELINDFNKLSSLIEKINDHINNIMSCADDPEKYFNQSFYHEEKVYNKLSKNDILEIYQDLDSLKNIELEMKEELTTPCSVSDFLKKDIHNKYMDKLSYVNEKLKKFGLKTIPVNSDITILYKLKNDNIEFENRKISRKLNPGLTHSYYIINKEKKENEIIRKYHSKEIEINNSKIQKEIKTLGKGGINEIFHLGKTLNSEKQYVVRKPLNKKNLNLDYQKCSILKEKCGDKLIDFHVIDYKREKSEKGEKKEGIVVFPVMDGEISKLNFKELKKEDCQNIILQICDDVKVMHDKNIVHFDIKLGNILFKKDNENNLICRLVDFDTIQLMSSEKSVIPIQGTKSYMPKTFREMKDTYVSMNFDEAKTSDLFALIRVINHIDPTLVAKNSVLQNALNEKNLDEITIDDIISIVKNG